MSVAMDDVQARWTCGLLPDRHLFWGYFEYPAQQTGRRQLAKPKRSLLCIAGCWSCVGRSLLRVCVPLRDCLFAATQ